MPANTGTIEVTMMTMEQQGIVFYGMMGSGKSTLGEGLAQHLGFAYIDTDAIITETYGMTCGDLVQRGKFVDAQLGAILGFEPENPTVIATGGSVAMTPISFRILGSSA